MQWKQRWKNWMVPQPGTAVDSGPPCIEPGMYHYQRPRDDGYMRFHLRVEHSGESLLIAGASEAVRLSRAGTTVIKRLLDGGSAADVSREFPQAAGERLVAEVQVIIAELGDPSSRFPIFNISDPLDGPREASLIAPFQADVEIEDLARLRPILQKLWEAGIPHARFVPAAELPDDQLVQAVEWAEDLGMIAGIRATATWLSEANRLPRLAAVGTDYLIFPWAVDADLHSRWFGEDDLNCLNAAMRSVREFEMTPVIEIPLVAASVDALEDELSRLTAWNVVHAEVFALAQLGSGKLADDDGTHQDGTPRVAAADLPLPGPSLRQIAAWIEEIADEHSFHLTWLPPVAVKPTGNVAEHARRGPRAGGDVTIRVLANGDVLPPRGAGTSAGNLFTNSWSEIWSWPEFRVFRQRVEANTRCEQCPGLAICAADCPADSQGWSHD